MLDPIDYRSVCRSVKRPMSKETPSLRRRSNHAKDAHPSIGGSVIARSPPSPLGYSINGASSTNSRQQNVVISHASGWPIEEEPGFEDPVFSPSKRERETRRASWVFRPASSGGPALQTLSPPPVKVNLAVRRGIPVPSRLPSAPPPQERPRNSIGRYQLPCESAPNISDPVPPASLTPEEGLIQLQIRTQQVDSNTQLGYRRSFRHIRGLSPQTYPTSLPTISVTTSTHPEGSDDPAIVTISEGLLIGSLSESSVDELETLCTPPDDASPNIVITRSRKGSNAPSDHLQLSARTRSDKYASSFLDFEPGTPRSPHSPATQSPFGVAQAQQPIYYGRCSPKSVGVPVEQGGADASNEGLEQRGWGNRKGARPIQSPGISSHSMRGFETRPGPLPLGTPHTDSRDCVYSSGTEMGAGRHIGGHRTRAVGQSQGRKSGVRHSHRPRSRSGTTATRKSYIRAVGGTISAIRGAGVFPEISSRMTDKGSSPFREWHDDRR